MLGNFIKRLIKPLLPLLVKSFGFWVQDTRTGKNIGKVILLPWRGTIRVIGLPFAFVAPKFAPSHQTFYWHQSLEFYTHPPVDFPRTAFLPVSCQPVAKTLWVILAHQSAKSVEEILSRWELHVPRNNLLLLYGGTDQAEFDLISHSQKLLISDPRLHTTAHILQKQSYTECLRGVANWMEDRRSFTHVYFAESDLFPMRHDVENLLLSRIKAEKADALFFHLHRVDGTNWCHLLYHQSSEDFCSFFPSISLRQEKDVILNAIGCGSFWSRECFEAITNISETTPIFLELYLPTIAHHLGFRVIEMADQNDFISVVPKSCKSIKEARQKNAWFIHPVKDSNQIKLN